MSTHPDNGGLESSIAPHLRRESHTPRHRPGSYTPPYPSFSARFGEQVEAVVIACFGVQVEDATDPALPAALAGVREAFGQQDGPAYWDRAECFDLARYRTVVSIGYWDDPSAFARWYEGRGISWTDPSRVEDGIGFFLELVTPPVERLETIFSSTDRPEGVAGMSDEFSGMIEEHFYWGSARDRLAASQSDPLYPEGEPRMQIDGPIRTVVLHGNACLIRSGQDITDTGDRERDFYLREVEPSLREGMEFLSMQGVSIGCLDNRYMVVLDEQDHPTDRTFGMSWWRDLSALEEWAASHPSHLKIYGAGMRHLSGFGPETRLRLYHEVTVPTAAEQRFVYVGCHDRTGLLRAMI